MWSLTTCCFQIQCWCNLGFLTPSFMWQKHLHDMSFGPNDLLKYQVCVRFGLFWSCDDILKSMWKAVFWLLGLAGLSWHLLLTSVKYVERILRLLTGFTNEECRKESEKNTDWSKSLVASSKDYIYQSTSSQHASFFSIISNIYVFTFFFYQILRTIGCTNNKWSVILKGCHIFKKGAPNYKLH